MSNLLDDRARQAARGIQRAVDSSLVRLDRIPGTVARPTRGPVWSAAAGAVAAVAVIAGILAVRSPEITAPISVATPTAPTVTEPAPDPVVVPPPVSTTQPAVTTTVPVDVEPPLIEITFPEPGHVSEEKSLTFRGVTEPGAIVTAGKYKADVAADGSWSITLILSEGEATARFLATDPAGNTAQASVNVVYEKPVVTATTKPEVAFTANKTYGSCSDDPPYDVYYGTGQPGTTISVLSEFGSGSTVVSGDGGWELKVFFPSAPPGQVFVVKVLDAFGNKKTFEFVSLVGL